MTRRLFIVGTMAAAERDLRDHGIGNARFNPHIQIIGDVHSLRKTQGIEVNGARWTVGHDDSIGFGTLSRIRDELEMRFGPCLPWKDAVAWFKSPD